MRKNITSAIFGLATALCIVSCDKKYDYTGNVAELSSWQIDNPKDTAKDAYVKIDNNLHAFAADCSNNHTIRIYYNQAYPINETKDYKIVAGPKDPSKLAANEVYIEVSTSATDTYISTGTDGALFHLSYGIDPWPAHCTDVLLQHYTSVPTTQTAKLTGSFWIYPE